MLQASERAFLSGKGKVIHVSSQLKLQALVYDILPETDARSVLTTVPPLNILSGSCSVM